MKRPKPSKWNKKVLIPVVIVAVALSSFGAYALLSPPTNSNGGYVCDETVDCIDDKLCESCTCPEFYDKIEISSSFGGGWYCELSDLFLDPDSPSFHSDTVDYVRGYLTQNCGDLCTDLTCGDNELCYDYDTGAQAENRAACIDVAVGQGNTGERMINAECVITDEWTDSGEACTEHSDCNENAWFNCIERTCQQPKSGVIDWRMNFFLEGDEELPRTFMPWNNYCVNPEKTERCEPPMEVLPFPTTLSIFQTCDMCLPRINPLETGGCLC